MSTKTIPLAPVGNRIIVLPAKAEGITPGGIVLPENSRERPTTGEVVAVGPGERTENGTRLEMEFSEGQTVFFKTYSGSDIEYDGETYKILSEDDVLAVLEG